jgi:anti-sigma factor RsiW
MTSFPAASWRTWKRSCAGALPAPRMRSVRLQLKRLTQSVGHRYAPRTEFRRKIEQSSGALKRPQWAKRWMPAFAAVAALGLVLISAVLWEQHLRGEQTLDELADLHVSTFASANPVDVVSTHRHTVKPRFQGKLPFSFNLPQLQNSWFRLVGGRAYFQQSPGAQLLFEIRKHQISVFIFQTGAELSRLNS